MVCGEGLHCLCGFDHFSSRTHSCGLDFCRHSGHESPDASGHPTLRASDHDRVQVSEADCPICSFFAQAHGLAFLPPTLCGSLTVVDRIAVARCLDVGDTVSAYRSRAPPLSAL
jgi:hypothetical protein